ncbi:methyltransferase small [Planctopirus limnophila DSM 3776]|uniref:Methyltransferase small n=1 Tax=Planctopirus limnophila (strain ATCC 43296 / DSM 3776 / IFAM 1008 / Mu 290) TaxID=521674 RepID=D5SMV0_PLAL2|nr:class I SAM-dependent rRNA methyltransferase [Planctopirus limnophila]ADG68005.1 methyltransferase small [Planctopirus limnophila DSM 3776]
MIRVVTSRQFSRGASRHPWLFDSAIDRVEGQPQVGDEVLVVGANEKFLGYGLYNSSSRIRVRIYSWNEDQPLAEDFWRSRVRMACDLRRKFMPTPTVMNGSRLISSEADFLSGLTVDRYGDWLLAQLGSHALQSRMELLVDELMRQTQASGCWLRTEKGIRQAEGMPLIDGLFRGETPPAFIPVEEHGLVYHVDLVDGQKTGFYLDQRENRFRAAQFASGNMLDLCCYSAGFGMNALRHGEVTHVIGVDTSKIAVENATANVTRNGLADRYEVRHGDAFEVLTEFRNQGVRFQTIVLDPPKLVKSRSTMDSGLKGYHSLNRLALDVLEPQGTLVTCSCSGLVTHDLFQQVLREAAWQARRELKILEARGPSPDHPQSLQCPESNYLKCYITTA